MSKIKRIRAKKKRKLSGRSTNYGFQPPVRKDTDFFLGSKKLGSVEINSFGDWRLYLPLYESQSKNIETQSCVSFGTLSALEMICKLQYNFEPNFSDRFLSKMSGTDPRGGNNPVKVADTVRKAGTVPESWYPFVDDLDEYFKEINQELKDLGLKWLENWEFGWEWCSDLREALKRSPVGVAVSAWQMNDKGEYIRFGASNHWCVLVAFDDQDRPVIWDSYDGGLKTLAKGFALDFPMIYVLKKKPTAIEKEYKSGNHYLVLLKKAWEFIKDIWFYLF